ncbi:hypothetical protein HK102_004738, partial [Quaeritorhiza haematococci]
MPKCLDVVSRELDSSPHLKVPGYYVKTRNIRGPCNYNSTSAGNKDTWTQLDESENRSQTIQQQLRQIQDPLPALHRPRHINTSSSHRSATWQCSSAHMQFVAIPIPTSELDLHTYMPCPFELSDAQ